MNGELRRRKSRLRRLYPEKDFCMQAARKLESMMALVQVCVAEEGAKISSSWPTVQFARLYCEREAGASLQFKAVSVGVWEAQMAARFYRITLSQPFQERDLVTATALLQI
jgi:hypothetical protein